MASSLRSGLSRAQAIENRTAHESCRHWHAVIVEGWDQLVARNAGFRHQQRAHLRVAVLLDDENTVVGGTEGLDLRREGKGTQAQCIHFEPVALKQIEPLDNGR